MENDKYQGSFYNQMSAVSYPQNISYSFQAK